LGGLLLWSLGEKLVHIFFYYHELIKIIFLKYLILLINYGYDEFWL